MQFYAYATNYQTYTIRRWQEESQRLSYQWHNITSFDGPNLAPGILWFRNFGLNYSQEDCFFVEQNFAHLRVVNPLTSISLLRDKYQQYLTFSELGLPVISSLLIQDFLRCQKTLPGQYQGPLVLKTRRGLQGKGVSLHPNLTALIAFWQSQHQGHPFADHFMVQPFIGLPRVEMRLFFWGGERIILEKIPGQDFRNNARFARFHHLSWHNLATNMQQLLEKIIAASNCFYGAIDFFATDDGCILIEVNSMPGIEMLEATTNRNIAAELLRESLLSYNC